RGRGPGPRALRAYDGLPHGSRALRARQRDHGAIRARTLSVARRGRRRGPAARRTGRDRRHPARGVKAGKLEKLGLRSRFDFVLHLPLRYEDETVVTAVHAAPPGRPVLVEARVQRAAIVFRPNRQLLVNAEGMVLRFFHFRASQLAQFKQAIEVGRYVRAFGEVRGGLLGAVMAHPRYRFVAGGEPLPQSLTPVYPSWAGIGLWTLRSKVLDALY